MPSLRDRLHAAAPDACAAIDDRGDRVSYAELIARAERQLAAIGAERQLVLIEGENSVAWLVAYLAAQLGGHPILMAPGGNAAAAAQLAAAFGPSVRMTAGTGFAPEPTGVAPPAMHSDLALMLSTSGSTGSAKCVRLSHANLAANAASIAAYLELGADERGLANLPTHYSYGLSVVNSHLWAGGTVLFTAASVIEPAFWDFAGAHGATSFAGVPHSYELLSRLDLADKAPPSLRMFTQAGGRLPEPLVRHFAALAADRGWRFFVMYGQTEATARMAYLPPAEVAARPTSIGIAIPDGAFSLIDEAGATLDGADRDGELVYQGPNVMMGYAMEPADLAFASGPSRLPTGDIARRDADGYYQITGRLSRFVKIFGNRMGLDDVERLLGAEGHATVATGIDDQLLVVTRDAAAVPAITELVATRLKLPAGYFEVRAVDEYPLLASGKIDYAALKATLQPAGATSASAPAGRTVAQVFAATFGDKAHDETASFRSLGGDSLNYISVALGLEEVVGDLPDDWSVLSVGALTALARERGPAAASSASRRTLPRNLETLRALACMLVVMYHVVGSTPGYGLKLPMDSPWHHFVDLFQDVRMPLFTAMAGFLYGAMPAAVEGLGLFTLRKARMLLVPVLIVTPLLFALRGSANGVDESLVHAFAYGYLHLWFLYALMIIFVVVAVLDLYVSTSWRFWLAVLLITPFIAMYVPLPLLFRVKLAANLLPFFVLGLLLYRHPALLRNKPLLAGAIVIAVGAFVLRLLEMRGLVPDLLWLFFVAGIAMPFVLIRVFPQAKAIEWIGAYSFTIYLWHPVANAIARRVMTFAGLQHAIPVLFVVGTVAGVLLPIALHKVAIRNRLTSLALLGK